MWKLNLLLFLGLFGLINAPPVKKGRFAFPSLLPLGISNSTSTESREATVKATEGLVGVPYTEPSLRLRLFGHQRPVTKKDMDATTTIRPRLPKGRKKYNRFYPQEEKGESGDSPKADVRAGDYPTEMTLKVPHMSKHAQGNWLYNPWAVTYGDPIMDTRFAEGRRPWTGKVRYRVEDRVAKYKPPKDADKLVSVCGGRSKVMNFPAIDKWLPRMVYNFTFSSRTIWIDLRWELSQQGRSEECHRMNMTDFREYQECALRRNQRMEYMIPQYPLHQVGYNKYWQQKKKSSIGGSVGKVVQLP